MGNRVGALKRWANPTHRPHVAEANRRWWADPENRATRIAQIKAGRIDGKKPDNYKYKNLRTRGEDRKFERHLFVRYGIMLEDYERMYRQQNGACAFCRRRPERMKLHVDHDHRTGHIRGLLCAPCNRALGMLEGNMERVIEYLRKEVSVPSCLDE
jgi:hypothetical protein